MTESAEGLFFAGKAIRFAGASSPAAERVSIPPSWRCSPSATLIFSHDASANNVLSAEAGALIDQSRRHRYAGGFCIGMEVQLRLGSAA